MLELPSDVRCSSADAQRFLSSFFFFFFGRGMSKLPVDCQPNRGTCCCRFVY